MPSKKKSKKKEQSPDDIKVTLKPILGFSPRLYVPALWLAAVLALTFLLLVLPGLRNNGTWITIYTDPPGASVIVDGVRLGRSYEPVFVKKGQREILIRRKGFKDLILDKDIDGRVFASRIFPKKDTLRLVLEKSSVDQILTLGINEFASWSATDDTRDRYPLPSVLTDLGRDMSSTTGTVEADELLEALIPMTRESRHITDMARMAYFLNHPRAIPSPASLSSMTAQMAELVHRESLLPGLEGVPAGEEITELGYSTSELVNQSEIADIKDFYDDFRRRNSFARTSINGTSFVSIPGLAAPIGDWEIVATGNYNPRFGAEPVVTEIDPFRISVSEVSNEDFAVFLQENPEWRVDAKNELIGAALADQNYLASWTTGGPAPGTEKYPVTEISWHAAHAYAEWFGGKVYPNSEASVRLPREDEWEVAARLNDSVADTTELPAGLKASSVADQGAISLIGMSGNVREWCDNAFRYNEYLFKKENPSAPFLDPDDVRASDERPVRGGAYIDGSLPFPAAARGSLQGAKSSPVVGFRLVIPSS